VLGLKFKVKRLGSQFGKEVRKLVFSSPTYILPLPEGGGGVRKGWAFCSIPLKGIGQPRTL